jgi:hypothetical protein
MKVFLSWSGKLSHRIACELRDWLPSVVQSIKPYVSSEDIDKGARWSSDIAKELEQSTYGILCVTKDNIDASWLNFEAGALSKTIDKSFVSPFLFNLKRSDVRGPLLQFQSTVFEKEDVRKLLESINSRAPETERLDLAVLKRGFEVWWPHLETALQKTLKTDQESEPKKQTTSKQEMMLEEILDLSRSQFKVLRSPEELLPPGYLEYVLSHHSERRRTPDQFVRRMHEAILSLRDTIESTTEPVKSKLTEQLDIVHDLYHRIFEQGGLRRVRLAKPPSTPKPENEK